MCRWKEECWISHHNSSIPAQVDRPTQSDVKKPLIIMGGSCLVAALLAGVIFFVGSAIKEPPAADAYADTAKNMSDEMTDASVSAGTGSIEPERDANVANVKETVAEQSEEMYNNTVEQPISEIDTANDLAQEYMTDTVEPVNVPEEQPAAEYVLQDSNTRYLTKADLQGLSAEECRLARNELYARYGRKFSDEGLQNYFNACSWYQGTIEPDDFQETMLSEIEIANRDLIVEYEKEMGYR